MTTTTTTITTSSMEEPRDQAAAAEASQPPPEPSNAGATSTQNADGAPAAAAVANDEVSVAVAVADADSTTTTTLTTVGDTAANISATTKEGPAVGKAVVKKKKRRPARPQVDPETFKGGEIPVQTGTVFNIWYNKWSGGDREDKYISKAHAAGRCDILKDSGYTKADKIPGSYFCLFFARGLCPRGHECEYLHHLPSVHDLFNPNVDCFGRDKFSDYRDDMGGVGSFMRQNHTLYVGRIHVSDEIEEIVSRHFVEWGQVERSTFPCAEPMSVQKEMHLLT